MTRISTTLLAAALLASCASQAGSVQKSGFLTDYSRLTPGGKDDPILYYVKPGLDLSEYGKIEVDPVMIRASHADALKSVPREELSHLIKLFYDSVCDEVGAVKTLVSSPGPGTMRLRLAITELIGDDIGNDIVSTVHPVGIVTNVGSMMATGTRMWAGKVSIEGVLTNSMSGEVLAEFVDRRQGGDAFETGEWTQAEAALKYWAVAIRKKIAELSR